MEASCCQCGNCATCPCGPCKEFVFDVTDTSGEKVSKMAHVYAGCAKEAFTNADNFYLIFPKGSTWYQVRTAILSIAQECGMSHTHPALLCVYDTQRATMLAGVILSDFLYFERDPNKNNNNN